MTADPDQPSSPEGEAAVSSVDAVSAPAKKTPHRKVAVRPKVSTALPVALPVDEKAKVSRTRRKKTVEEGPAMDEAGGKSAPAPGVVPEIRASQARVLSTEEMRGSPEQEFQVETRVIPPEVMAKLEERTKEKFPHYQAPSKSPQPAAPIEPSPAVQGEALPVPPSPEVTQAGVAAVEPPESLNTDAKTSSGGYPAAAETTPAVSNPEQRTPSNQPGERRFDGERQPFQGRRGDHRQQQHGRGDFQPRGDHQQRGGNDYQGGRGGQQGGGFRQQGGGGGNGGGYQDRNQQDRNQQGSQNQQDRSSQERGPQGPQNQQGGGAGGDAMVSRVTETQYGEGVIEVSGKGFGFLREAKRNFVQTPADIFVTPEVCRKYNLRDGQWIKGEIRRSSRGPQLFRLTELNGEDPDKCGVLPIFEELTSINPKKRIKLETAPDRYTTRVIDLMTPIGKGQRGLIVAPPRTGKTTLLQHIAEAVVKNHPEMKLIILLVDERPEEVTEIRRSVPQAEVMASSNDSDIKSHTRIAQLAIERAKRLVEAGQDVFILLDSITRMARAFNNAMGGGGGRGIASGGLSVGALEIPRKIFAAARNTEEAGSLTIMATALIETNSKMDDAIFQEFKGTGNMELVLDRKISDQRIYPAVDIFLSGTRREELLLQGWELDKINVIRRGLAGHKPIEAIERLLSFLKKFPTNTQMLASLPG